MSSNPKSNGELACPHCGTRITFVQIGFAWFPVWLKCKGCGESLIGDRFIKAQGIVFVLFMVGWGICLWFSLNSLLVVSLLVALLILFGVTMTILTLKFGSYSSQGSSDGPGSSTDDDPSLGEST